MECPHVHPRLGLWKNDLLLSMRNMNPARYELDRADGIIVCRPPKNCCLHTKVDNVPQLLGKYEGKEEKLFQALVKKYGPEPEDPYYQDDDVEEDDEGADDKDGEKDKKERRGVGAKKTTKVDTRVVIQKIARSKKKATTVIVGMDTVPNVKLKDVSKAFSKRFASSSSVKDGVKGKEIIIQGDHMDDVAEMIVHKFGVPGGSVYLDVDGEFVPFEQ
mmetsp:Transcript_8491/g.19671  ORF Transcript_8491/g.19671 Transcript_8491/m.19671 type:complete len:217 (-) Transcript_8491:909-1559(-)